VVAASQTVLPEVQVLPAQHACPCAPQVPQLPLAHVPPMVGHVAFAAAH
jgi:hypothetical protein